MEVSIPNPESHFWNCNPKIHFWVNWTQKSKVFRFVWKLVHIVSQGLSESRLRVLEFRPQNPVLGKFGSKYSKLSVLSKNWYTKYFKDADFKFRLRFLKFWSQNPFLGKFGPKKSKLSVLSKSWHTWYLENADSYFSIYFLNFKLKIHFWPNLGQKSEICQFYLKIGTLGILRMWILIPRLVSWILKPKSI